MALDRPTLKMSKSHQNPKSRIHLTDSENEINKKIRVALTDSIEGVSYQPEERPGVSNLIDLVFHLDPKGATSAEELSKDFEGLSLKALKERAAEVINGRVAPIRERYREVMDTDGGREVDEAAEQGARKAIVSADKTIQAVRKAVGLA
jgi:tryptophanyl-tRNA synthetase